MTSEQEFEAAKDMPNSHVERLIRAAVTAAELALLEKLFLGLNTRDIGNYNDGGDRGYRERRDAIDAAYNQGIREATVAINAEINQRKQTQ